MSAPGVEVADGPSVGDPGPRSPAAAPLTGTAGRVAHPRWLIAAAVAASSLALFWIGAVALSANHGFDISDEGFYLLSYRWWHDALRTFTGVQLIYGPVFEFLGYSITGLRLFRLATVVATMATFGWAFMGWLRGRRPNAPASRLWEVSGTAAVVASGAMTYGWLPLSPGYNDVSMLGALLGAAIVLRMATHIEAGRPIRLGLAVAMGPLTVAMVLAKWASAGLTLFVVGAVGILVLGQRGWREVLRVLGWTVAAAAVTVLLVQFFEVSLPELLSNMVALGKMVAAGTSSPTGLLSQYVDGLIQLGKVVVRRHWPLLLAGVLVVVLRGRRGRWAAGGLALAAIAVAIHRMGNDGSFHGGNTEIGKYSIAIFAIFTAVVVIGLAVLFDRRRAGAHGLVSSIRRTDWRGWAVVAMLLVIPFTQAAGTGNAIYYISVNCFAAWVALIIAVVTGIEAAPAAARGLAAVTLAGALVFSVIVGTDGVWNHPYRNASRSVTTAAVRGVPALSSIRLDPASATKYAALYDELRPYVEPAGRSIMAFDEMSGVVFLLGGRSVGEAWYSEIDHQRSAAGIRAECADGHPLWGNRSPVVIFNRAPTAVDAGALQACGLDLMVDYRLLPTLAEAPTLRVYVPVRP